MQDYPRDNSGYAQQQRRRKRRRLKRSARRALVLVAAVAVMLGLAGGITSIIQGMAGPVVPYSDYSPPPGPVSTAPGISALPPSASVSQGVPAESWNFTGPVPQDAAQMVLTTPDSRMIALPENGRVDMTYFDTVTFVGDSITQGLQMWKTIPNARYCAYRSINPRQIYDGSIQKNMSGVEEVPMDAIVAGQPRNVYVLLGTNTMVSYSDEDLLAYYSQMLDVMKERLPGVGIYVQSITPAVTGVDARLDLNRIHGINDQLAKLAYEKGMYYLDLHEALAGEDGGLRPESGAASDGYHMTAAGAAAWTEYLLTHTAYSPNNPYLEGSHYYTPEPVGETA